MNTNRTPFWVLYRQDADEGYRLGQYDDDRIEDPEKVEITKELIQDSYNTLVDTLNTFASRKFRIIFKQKAGAYKANRNGIYEVFLDLTPKIEPTYKPSDAALNGVPKAINVEEEVQKEVRRILAEKAKDQEIADLKEKLREKGTNKSIERALDMIEPHMSDIIESMGLKGTKTKSIAQKQVPELSGVDGENHEKILENAIRIIVTSAENQNIDGVLLLNKIAKKVKAKPSIIQKIQRWL